MSSCCFSAPAPSHDPHSTSSTGSPSDCRCALIASRLLLAAAYNAPLRNPIVAAAEPNRIKKSSGHFRVQRSNTRAPSTLAQKASSTSGRDACMIGLKRKPAAA